MKNSAYAISIISLAISALSLSGSAVADGVTNVTLSSSPLYKVHKVKKTTCALPRRVAVSRNYKRIAKVAPRRVISKKVVRITSKRKVVNRKRIARPQRIVRSKRIVRNNKRIVRISKKTVFVRPQAHGRTCRYHYVRSGDSLSKIAKQYRVSVKHLIKVNKLKSTTIRKGITLKI